MLIAHRANQQSDDKLTSATGSEKYIQKRELLLIRDFEKTEN